MRKLIMWNVMTLDGCFEGSQSWDLSFHGLVWGAELEALSLDQLRSADYLVFGRRTYEGMAAYWAQAEAQKTDELEVARLMNSLPKLVVSRTLPSANWNNTTIIRENVSEEIRKLKAQGGKDMYVFGSANLSETLIQDNLFDEYRICVAPTILGEGKPLFRHGHVNRKLDLISSRSLQTGGVVLKYAPHME